MSAQSQPRMTPEQYLEIERAAQDVRSEFYNGRMYAMSGASYRHVMLISGLSHHLRNGLAAHACSVGTNDLRVRVSPAGLYTYPDVVVICGDPRFADQQTDTVLNPTLIIEVLSPSTEAYDRGFKFAQYRTLEFLREYALVSQFGSRIQIFRRQPSGDWLLSESAGMETACRFDSMGCTVTMKDVYDKVTFDGEAAIADKPSPQA
jgi:Uma2 family endonuclease